MKTTETNSVVKTDSLAGDISQLVKARLSFLVLITTLIGFLIGWQGPMDYFILAATVLGTALSAAGAAALNQWLERNFDTRMLRTQDRPLPAGRMHPTDALLMGCALSVSGVAALALFSDTLAALLSAITIATYVLVYTPLKRVTTLNTLVGAVPGALPPLIGWVAATGKIDLGGVLLFAILWFWQMPHFLAIAWMYRDDYRNAGFVMLSGNDPSGHITARQALIYSVYLTVVSLLPGFLGLLSFWSVYACLALGIAFSYLAWKFLRKPCQASARLLFFASIVYLPLLLAALLAAKN
ncbi:MAG: heme o synthase [Chthoniobacterales bacterium]